MYELARKRELCRILYLIVVTVLSVMAAACGGTVDDTASDDGEVVDQQLLKKAVDTYTEGVYRLYQTSLLSALDMQTTIQAFVYEPTPDQLAAAQDAWIAARRDYSRTEAFRFYNGPIDNAADARENAINMWPINPSYVDSFINNLEDYPTIDEDLLVQAHKYNDPTRAATGWHVIEFLLWGQDLSADGPGKRNVDDYTINPNADRRGDYLLAASSLLSEHLQAIEAAWLPDRNNYRAAFEALRRTEAMRRILTGVGKLSINELAERIINAPYTNRSEEDEQSNFSDNTTADIIGNLQGIIMVLTGEYSLENATTATGVLDVITQADEQLANTLREKAEQSLKAAEAIPAPFDQHLRDGVSDNDAGRLAVLKTIQSIREHTNVLVQAAGALNITLNLR